MAKIHVLDAYRDTSHIARLAVDLEKLLNNETEYPGFGRASLRIEAARLRKQADLLHYIWLNLQLQIDKLANSPNISPGDTDQMRRLVQSFGAVIEDIVKNIQSKTSSIFD
jgi:hypothetical protein